MNDFSKRIAKLSPERLSLLAAELHSRLTRLEGQQHEPVAVVGMGCRFPGSVSAPEEYWRNLVQGTHAVREIDAFRWDAKHYFSEDKDAPGKTTTRWAGLIDDVEMFDAHFFGIAAREAEAMDPQQRLLLEVCWEALERAGQAPDGLRGSRTGVFVGISGSDYYNLLLKLGESAIDAYFASGNAHSVASGRLSYFLGAKGPSFSVDTACSSSLVAIHLAVQSLRRQECRMALAGGVNLILSPNTTIALSKADMMSADGRCKAFDAGADGFVRGEGCGILVLKRMQDALADGDTILAAIAGSAINQDGRSNGLTAPNGPSQEDVIRLALADARIAADEIDYIETHGTGTSLGDPIEMRALGAVYGRERTKQDPLIVGAAKTNVGHLESAAGVAGLIKLILAIQKGEIPPTLHFQVPNPHIAWDNLPVSVADHLQAWPSRGSTRAGGVSSFGFSGTNAHIIVTQAPFMDPAPDNVPERSHHLLTLSAKSQAALEALAKSYADKLDTIQAQELGDLCYTANTGRAHLSYRLAVVGSSPREMGASLKSFLNRSPDRNVAMGRHHSQDIPQIAFLFTGQGSQYVGMGRELYETHDGFRQTLESCDAILKSHHQVSLLSLLYPAPEDADATRSRLDETASTQPALFALEFALAKLMQSWGVSPVALMGHSVGEYVAACLSGVFSLEEGLSLISKRAALMNRLPAGGGMASVFTEADRVAAEIAPFDQTLSIAAVNGPASTVISGENAALASVVKNFEDQGIKAHRLNVSHAFHSPLMTPILDEFEGFAKSVPFKAAQANLISNVSGKAIKDDEILDSTYWMTHIRKPVQFAQSIQTLYDQGCRFFMEIGPKPILTGMGMHCLSNTDIHWQPTLKEGQSDWRQVLIALAALYVKGASIDWQKLDGQWSRRKISLPTYPFQRKRFWVDVPEPSRAESAVPPKEKWTDWLYEFDWEARPHDGAAGAPLDFFPGVDDLADAVRPEIPALKSQNGIDLYDTYLPLSDQLCSRYIIKAFASFGWNPQPEEKIEVSELASRFEIQTEHRHLFHRLFGILEEDHILRRQGDGWIVNDLGQVGPPERLREQLLNDYPQFKAELALLGSCGAKLAEVLQGKQDPMAVLFPDGSMDLTENMYKDSPVLRFYNGLIQQIVKSLTKQAPAGRKLKVLEIGAGTGGTTSWILPVLKDLDLEYVYTDISDAFLHHAQKKFKEYTTITYRKLDISRDPLSQGVLLQEFDIVLAANVLHATLDLGQTVSNIEKILAPGGALLLLEGVNFQRFSDLTVGLTRGWWHFQDRALRPEYALLPVEKWDNLLTEKGFDAAAFLPDVDGNKGVLTQQSVILAFKPEDAASQAAPEIESDNPYWLIFADGVGLGERMEGALKSMGRDGVVVHKGNEYRKVNATTYTIDPLAPDQYKQLFSELASKRTTPCESVAYLWGIDGSIQPETTVDNLQRLQETICGSALSLVQTLSEFGQEPAPILSIVTRNAQKVSPEDKVLGFGQATLWGLGRVIALEHPELNCVRIDIDNTETEFNASALLNEIIVHHAEEKQIAYRNDRRYVLRIQESPAGEAAVNIATLQLQPDAGYLITGGLAGLGLITAQWMVERGARQLYLMGRSEASPDALKLIEAMREKGADVHAVTGDVANPEDLQAILNQLADKNIRLGGVVHSAGVLDDGVLTQQRWERFRHVMQAKVFGAWVLHQCTKDDDLDFFILFSSGAGFLGSVSQGNHAAANAFLDALAFYRRSAGLPALTINWGAWDEVGSATRNNVIRRIRMKGMELIQPGEGLDALAHLMQTNPVQAGVFPFRWSELLSDIGHSNEKTLFERFNRLADNAQVEGPKDDGHAFLQSIEQYPPSRQREHLLHAIKGEVAKILGINEGEVGDTHQPLVEMGLDSLMAVELRNALSAMVDRPLPATLLFNYPSLGEVVSFMEKEVLNLDEETQKQSQYDDANQGSKLSAREMNDYSEEEMARLLAEKLQSL